VLQNEAAPHNFSYFQEALLGLHQQFCYIDIIFDCWWGSEAIIGFLHSEYLDFKRSQQNLEIPKKISDYWKQH